MFIVPVNEKLLTGTDPVNNELLTGTVPVNKKLLTGILWSITSSFNVLFLLITPYITLGVICFTYKEQFINSVTLFIC